MAKQYDYGYEDILEKHLRSMIRDCDRRIELANKRIEDNEREIVCNITLIRIITHIF